MITENDMKEMLNLINGKKAKKVFIQLPEGLKMDTNDFSTFLEDNGIEAIFSAEPCFGACDLKDHEAKILGCDALLHVGHADFGVGPEIPVIYYEMRFNHDFILLLEKNIHLLEKFQKIGLITTIQYVDEIPKIRKFLENSGKTVLTGKNKKTGYHAHVLGCDFTAVDGIIKNVDCIIYFGSGRFHPTGLITEKSLFSADIEKAELIDVSGDIRKSIIKKELAIEKAKGLQNFVIYVSIKPGQRNSLIISKLKSELKSKGKDVIVISADMLSPEKLLGIKYDVIVNTACPRITDDSKLFGKVILNANDIKKL